MATVAARRNRRAQAQRNDKITYILAASAVAAEGVEHVLEGVRRHGGSRAGCRPNGCLQGGGGRCARGKQVSSVRRCACRARACGQSVPRLGRRRRSGWCTARGFDVHGAPTTHPQSVPSAQKPVSRPVSECRARGRDGAGRAGRAGHHNSDCQRSLPGRRSYLEAGVDGSRKACGVQVAGGDGCVRL